MTDRLRANPALAWIGRKLDIEQIEGRTVLLRQREAGSSVFFPAAHQQQLADALSEVLGFHVAVQLRETTPRRPTVEPSSDPASAQPSLRDALNVPLVSQLMDLFDLTITDVRNEAAPVTTETPTQPTTLEPDDSPSAQEQDDV